MSQIKFETFEVEDGIYANLFYEDSKVGFIIKEKDLQKVVEAIFLAMPFDVQKETVKEFTKHVEISKNW